MVRILLEDDREERERVVEVRLVGEAHRLAAQEVEVVGLEDQPVLECLQGFGNAAEVEQDSPLCREGAAVPRVQVQGLIVRGERVLRAPESSEERAFRVPCPTVHRVHADRPVQGFDGGVRLTAAFEGSRQLTQRVRVARIDLEQPLAYVGRGLERMLCRQEVALEPQEIGVVRRDRGSLRDRRQGILRIARGLCEACASRPCVRVFRVRHGQANAHVECILRPSERLERPAQPGERRRLFRILREDGLVHREGFLVSMELRQARALFQQGRDHRRIERRRFAVRGRGLLVTLEPVQRGPLAEPRLRVIRVEREGSVERRDGLLVALLPFEGEAEEVPAFHVARRVPRRSIEAVDRVREGIEPVMRPPFLVPQARGRRVRLDGDVKRLHRIGVASEGEQESGLSGRRVRVPGIEPEHGVERGQRVLRLIQRLMGLSPRGPGAGVRGIFLEDRLARPEEDLRVLGVSQGVSLAAKGIEIVRGGHPEALERRVCLLGLAEREEGSTLVFQGPGMVRLDREDRVARDDEIGPTLGAEEQIPLRLEAVVGAGFDGQEAVQSREGFLPAVQLDARVRLRVQRSRVPGLQGHDFRRLLDDVVPSGQRAKRLQPTDAGGEGLRRETDRAVVRADRIDAPTNLAQ